MTSLRKQRARTVLLNYTMLTCFAGAALAGAGLLAGCNGHADAAAGAPGAGPGGGAPPRMNVSVVKADESDVAVAGEWVGTMDGYVNAQIQPQAAGYLVKQDYREGGWVEKDSVLFEIDPRPFEAALAQAQGSLGQAKAQLQLAEINVKRDTPLAEAHAIARSQLDNDTQQKAQAEAAVASAQAAVDTANLNLGFTKVRSLISGIAGQATTQVGNLVSTQSVLTSVSQLNPIKVYFSIGDSEYLALTRRAGASGSDLLHGAKNLPLTLTLANGDVYPQKGHVVFVDRQLNSQTGAIRIAASFPNPGNILRPGQFGRVKAETEVLHNAIIVPQVAITELQGMQQIYTVGANDTVHVNSVVLGPQYGNGQVVTSGLPAGSLVITDNLQKLREGAPVNPQTVDFKVTPTAPPTSPEAK
jgi:RND family efflux transporter MFP subunit